ncbi:hypothetical protein [Halobaculum sp. EA56]|uniref:hypothetical protein n=1 Tax=Halobaculum sp. EA56 TaxID=3421648 RepID=UPI003EBE5EC7
MSERGRITWPSASDPLWELDWELDPPPRSDGLTVRNVRYRGQQVLYRGSLPSLTSINMPGAGQFHTWSLNYATAEYRAGTPGKKVSVYTGYYGDTSDVGLETHYDVPMGGGTQRWTQRWRFWADGQIQPQLFSYYTRDTEQNWSHMPDWRLDFDVTGASDDLALLYDPTETTGHGWGKGWIPERNERRWWVYSPEGRMHSQGPTGPSAGPAARTPGTAVRWAVMDKAAPNRGYMIAPRFSDHYAVRYVDIVRYRGDETAAVGTPYRYNRAFYQNGEDTEWEDAVVWYGGFMWHREEGTPSKRHLSEGPTLWPFRYH